MAVWTISFEAGSGGEVVAGALAERAGAPLIDRQAVVAIAHALQIELENADQLEHHPPGGRLEELALALAASVPLGAGAVAELRRQPTLRAVTERIIREAARQRCVTALRGRRGDRAYRLGDRIDVRVEKIDRSDGKVELAAV